MRAAMLREQSARLLARAGRVRHLGRMQTSAQDRETLLTMAAELEADAWGLEAQARAIYAGEHGPPAWRDHR